MERNAAAPSLLPYLDSAGAPLSLRLPLTTEDPALRERLPFPFQVIIDSDPLTRLYEAHVASDGGATLARLFLLVQRDHYRISAHDLWPITNRTIDGFWQESLSAYQGQTSWKMPFLLSHQVDNAGRFIPCRPLLFCKRMGSFFHPPCPACGQELELCTDDELLTQVGLSPYSTSLRRYLSCPACLAGGKIPELYVYERAQETSPVLKDRHELFQSFNRLIDNPSLAAGLPCLACIERGGCYGVDQRALANLVPFSFYPFYLLAFQAASLPVLDFAALIAGAAPGQLEASLAARGEGARVRSVRRLGKELAQGGSFLFAGEDRWFLEILYLKLSLLGDLARSVFSGFVGDRHPELGFAIDQVWVELSGLGGLLPSFWSCKTGPLALLGHQRERPQAPPAYGLHLLGLGWMAVLLANSGQDISHVYRSLTEEMAAPRPAESALPPTGVFAPENIFWNPGARTVRDEYRPLWEKALVLGWSLLRGALGADPPWQKETFVAQLDELRREVRTGLFHAGGARGEDTNAAIQQILVAISRRWAAVPERAAKEPARSTPKAEPVLGKEREEIPATVMISPEALGKLATPPKAERPPKPAKEQPRSAPQPPPEAEEEEIPATVMISPGAMPRMGGPLPDASQAPGEAAEKTPGKKAKEPPSDDFELKTVFISPERRKDKDSEEEQ
jgi:hypothetical protein